MIIDISTKIGTTSNQGGFKGLLDVYSGAAAAYSLRKLSKATTSVVRVRRDSDNAEADFTALEITDGTLAAFCTGTDGLVTTWYDQSGNGNDATQGTASRQPKIVSAGVLVTDNGKPAVLINAATGNSSIRLQTQGFALNQPFTMLASATSYDVSDIKQQLTDNRGALVAAEIAVQANASTYTINSGTPLTYKSPAINGTAIHYGLFNSASSSAGYNGSTTNGNAGTGNADGLTIGGARGIGTPLSLEYGWVGSIYELVVYPTDQSTNRSGIEANINKHYNIYP